MIVGTWTTTEVVRAVLAGGAVLLLARYLARRVARWRRLPPGPWGLPLVGCLPSMYFQGPDKCIKQWRKQFGPVVYASVGNLDVIFLTTVEAIREVFVNQKQNFSNRPETMIVQKVRGAEKGAKDIGISNANGAFYHEHRKFIHKVMREFGLGRPLMEEAIHTEISFLFEKFQKFADEKTVFNPRLYFSVALGNVMFAVLMGKRQRNLDDPQFQELLVRINELLRSLGPRDIFNNLPWLDKWLPKNGRSVGENFKFILDTFVKPVVAEHKENFANNNDGTWNDFIDAYLLEQQKNEATRPTIYTDRMLHYSLVDMLFASEETTTSTICWSIVFLANAPEIQKKVQEELDRVVGSDGRHISVADKSTLPYCMATIHEVERLGTVAALAIPHTADEDAVVYGNLIPAGSLIVPTIRSVMLDEDVWGDPENFRPERFLNDCGEVIKPEAFIPFGVGPRSCIGEILAKMQVFLYFTNLFHRFKITAANGNLLPTKGVFGMMHQPQPFEIVLHSR